ncbi:hypothetical protein QOT17_009764 [Balamuthia mandrillaris]
MSGLPPCERLLLAVAMMLSFTWLAFSQHTGYFQPEATGTDPSCPEENPCPSPFPFLASATFDEYVLAGGEYTFYETIPTTQNLTIRRWWEREEQAETVLIGRVGGGITPCFTVSEDGTLPLSLAFSGFTIRCKGMAFYFHTSPPLSVKMKDIAILSSNGGISMRTDTYPDILSLSTSNLFVQDISCTPVENLAFRLERVQWTFKDVSFVNNCLGMSSRKCTRYFIFLHRFLSLSLPPSLSHSSLSLSLSFSPLSLSLLRSPFLYLSSIADFRTAAISLYWTGVESVGGKMLFLNNGMDSVFGIYGGYLHTDGTTLEFVNNKVPVSLVSYFSPYTWETTGLIAFRGNRANSLIDWDSNYDSGLPSFYSLVPFDTQDNDVNATFSGLADTLCCSPCNTTRATCICNDKPVLSWTISSDRLQISHSDSSLIIPLVLPLPTDNDLTIPIIVLTSEGFLYGQHYLLQPPLNSSSDIAFLDVEVPQNASRAEIIVTKLVEVEEEAILTLQVAPGQFFNSDFFLSRSMINVVFAPPPTTPPSINQTVYQPDGSVISVSFPNNDKPDHTVILHEEQGNRPLANRSVTAQFLTLQEVGEDGQVIAIVSLAETEFVATELGNTSFNLNHALPFISFSAEISSILLANNQTVDLVEEIVMQVNFTMFAEEQVINFAGVEQVMAANTLKWSVFLSSWPFQPHSHSLYLRLILTSQDGPIALETLDEEDNGVLAFTLRTENTEIPFNVLPLALVDEGLAMEEPAVAAVWEGEGQHLVIQLPWFNHSLLLDPDISLLLTDEAGEESNSEGDSEDLLWWKIAVPVLSVVVVVVVVVVAVSGSIFLKKRSNHRRLKVKQRLGANNTAL